ncbi:vanillyl alcohol oxidase [Fusarium oxysporum II5]|nr:vanillyl alcohol oxidase [Fusarium oxysporum II5]
MATVNPLVLLPGVAPSVFHQFISEVTELDKQDYRDPSKMHRMFDITSKQHFVSTAVITPRNVAEAQAIVKLYNKFEIPLWPFSTGRNVGYGGAAPRIPGSISLNLGKHINKILKVNVDGAYALVEPGVTYADLYQSLVDNNLERGVGYTPYNNYISHGTLVCTGMGALPNPYADLNAPLHEQEPNSAWQLFNYGFGPYNDGIFMQSSLSIVIKMGIWLMAIEIIRPLQTSMVLQNIPTVRHLLLDAAVIYTTSKKPLNDKKLNNISEKFNLGRWNFYGALYGPEPIRKVIWEVIKGAFSAIPRAKFYIPEDMPNNYTLTCKGCKEAGFDFIRIFIIGIREMHHIVYLIFNHLDLEPCHRAHALISQLIDDTVKKGWGKYRTYLVLIDQIAQTYNFNNNTQMHLNIIIKNILDPNGILAPNTNRLWLSGYNAKDFTISPQRSIKL